MVESPQILWTHIGPSWTAPSAVGTSGLCVSNGNVQECRATSCFGVLLGPTSGPDRNDVGFFHVCAPALSALAEQRLAAEQAVLDRLKGDLCASVDA